MNLPQPPELDYPLDSGDAYRPSWRRESDYLNDEHASIWTDTKDLPGWQDPPDSEKLYELAYHSGAVILEIGMFGGRSATVELRGALRGARDRGGAPAAPQYYGVDVDPNSVRRTRDTLRAQGLLDLTLLYHGDLARFHRDVPVVPTMVFLDGDHRYPGVWADLNVLRTFLAPGTPVLCHDYQGIPGVRRAIDEWLATGYYAPMGLFSGSILLRATDRCPGVVRGLDPSTFVLVRDALARRFFDPGREGLSSGWSTPTRKVTTPARRESRPPRIPAARWPYVHPDPRPLPPTLPNGHPWPKISVVTPSFNQGRYIEETILSVLNQGYPNVEHIVIDGGSTDETADVVARYRRHLAHAVSEPDKGQSDAINKGMARATGDIVTWLNSDDMLAPGALAAVAMAMHTSGADLVAGVANLYRDGALVGRHLTSCADGQPLPLQDLLDLDHCWNVGQFFYQPEVMFTRDLWDRAGGHVAESLYYSMDYELWLRFALAGARVNVIGRTVAHFRMHDEQKTHVAERFRAELVKVRDGFAREHDIELKPAPPRPDAKASLRVAFLNDIGFHHGAGIAHQRLAMAAAAAGHQVVPLALSPDAGAPAPVRGEEVLRAVRAADSDLVVLGNVHAASLEPAVVGEIAKAAPTVAVLHDLWLLTGRCAYTQGCARNLDPAGCDAACPTAGAYPALAPDRIAGAWRTKQDLLRAARPPVLLANSRWMLDSARRVLDALAAQQPDRPVTATAVLGRLGFPVDADLRPRDRRLCRELLGLPQDRFLILFSAANVHDPRKGVAHLVEALRKLDLRDVSTACVGFYDDADRPDLPDLHVLGYITDPKRLAMAYAAADLFVGPSTEEALGQVFVEAAACGTPSVGYPVGGVPEAILDGVTGRIAESVDPDALADAIELLHDDPALRRDLGLWARLHVENEWSLAAAAHRLHNALTAAGLADRLPLSRKISLLPDPPPVPEPRPVDPAAQGWRAVDGFGPWEGPYPQWNLPRCRWAFGPVGRLEFATSEPGRHRVILGCHNHEPGQRVQLLHAGRVVGEWEIPVTQGGPEHVVHTAVELPSAGTHAFELRYWKWAAPTADDARPRAILLTQAGCVRWEFWLGSLLK